MRKNNRLNSGQFVMINNEKAGCISHNGLQAHTKDFYWIYTSDGEYNIYHKKFLTLITKEVYDIAKECV